MNKLFSITAFLAFFLLFSAGDANAQKELTEGTIIMELTEIESDDPAMGAQLSMLKGSSNSIYFDKNQTLTKMDMMGGMVEMAILADNKTREGFMLFNMDMMGKKVKINITEEDVAKQKADAKTNNMTVTYDKTDTKKIAGYNCYKATISSPDMQGATVVAYVTKEITIKADVIQGVSSDIVDGFPLEYSIGAQGMSMVYTTTDIKDSVDKSVFTIDTAGYEEQSMEEFQKSMGAMGGGMGF